MSHIYKQAAQKQPEPLSFVKAVTEHGDHWQGYLPRNVQHVHEALGPDTNDFVQMSYMEKGLFPRIKHEDLSE